jgi:hypothetical protein
MINANELRIGNWYLGASRQEPLQATARFIQQLDEGLINCSPIPISSEILEKCGFTRLNNGWNMGEHKSYMDEIFSLFDENYCQGELDLRLNGSDLPMPKVKYLHQLQNLYYGLTGEELTFKP